MNEKPWLKLTWDHLEQDAESDMAVRRIYAVIRAHTKVERAKMLEIFWDDNLRRAIMGIRRQVVHFCHDPTIEEAKYAVQVFRNLWKKNIEETLRPIETKKRVEPAQPAEPLGMPVSVEAPAESQQEDIADRAFQEARLLFDCSRGRLRVYAIAAHLGIENHRLVWLMQQKFGIDVANHMSRVSLEDAEKAIRQFYEGRREVDKTMDDLWVSLGFDPSRIGEKA